MHEFGLAPDDWRDRVDYLGWHFGNEVGSRWWAYSKKGWPEDTVQQIDGVLAKGNYSGSTRLLDAIRQASKSGAA